MIADVLDIRPLPEEGFSDEPPPNYVYSAMHGPTIRYHFTRGMSRTTLERIYGRVAVRQVLDEVTPTF
jgi:hypothetical protein